LYPILILRPTGALRLHQLDAPVVANAPLTGDYWLIEVAAPAIAHELLPGQFVNIRIAESLAPFLRRPFSVYRVSRDRARLQVAYKVQGDGTRLMTTTMPKGGRCDVIGPLGRGFTLPAGARRIAVIGRGIGIAALPTLVDAAVARGIEVHAYLSARNAPNIVARDILAAHGCPATVHTDDAPDVPMVTDHLIALAARTRFDALYVCGSNRLARATHALATRLNISAQIAMEQHMACGFGDCHGCVIEVNLDRHGRDTAWREVCHYGPVFDTWEVVHAARA
jgi:dihydroorotate dehydrogenase electron transfer subunit